MVDAFNAGIMDPVNVWIMKPQGSAAAGYSFAWDWGAWVICKRLIPESDTELPGGMGQASFRLLRSQFSDNVNLTKPLNITDEQAGIISGAFICITVGQALDLVAMDPAQPNQKTPRLDPDAVEWFGFIDSIQGTQIAGTTEVIGTVTALEIGHLFDRLDVRGWRKRYDTASYSLEMLDNPTANVGGAIQDQVLGNAVISGQSDESANSIYIWETDPRQISAAAGKLWTRWRLLRTMLTHCVPDALDDMDLSVVCADGSFATDPATDLTTISGYLNRTDIPEVLDIGNQTFKGMIDLLVPRPNAFGWYPRLSGDGNGSAGVVIWIYSLSSSAPGDYGHPKFQTADITLSSEPVTSVVPQRQTSDQPDEIVVEGQPIIFGATVSYLDGNLDAGWAKGSGGDQQAQYLAGAVAAADYASLSTDEQLDRNRAVRQSPGVRDVFCRYVINPDDIASNPAEFKVYGTPGVGRSGSVGHLTPRVEFDAAGAVTVTDSSVDYGPYPITATLTRTLPWIEGIGADGTDSRLASVKPFPSFLGPKAFYFDSTKAAGKQWTDLLAKGGKRPTPALEIDDHGPAIRVSFDAPETLGLNTISITPTGVEGLYDLAGKSPVAGFNFFDWRNMALTVGIPSGQRLKVTARRPGVKDGNIRRRLTIRDEKLSTWIMLKGSILGIKKDGTPDRLTSTVGDFQNRGYVVRNDAPRALQILNRAAAFYFRERTGVTIERMRPDDRPAWASIGKAIGKVIEQAANGNLPEVALTCNTVVEQVDHHWNDTPRIVVTAALPSPPDVMGGSSSPSSGGPVSLQFGGTMAQAVQQARQELVGVKQDTQRMPIVSSFQPGGASLPTILEVRGGNTIFTLGASTFKGILSSGSITTVPVTTPVDGSTYADGLGYGYLISLDGITSSTLVWICNATATNAAGTVFNSSVAFPVPKGQPISSVSQVTLPCVAGGTATVYMVSRLG